MSKHVLFLRFAAALFCAVFAVSLYTGPAGAATGDISTVAGGGINDGAPASEAGIWRPWGVFVDGSGNIYIADWGGSQIQKIDAATGIINRVVGNGLNGRFLGESGEGGPATGLTIRPPSEVAADSEGNTYFHFQGAIRKADPSGTVTRVVSGGTPFTVDASDNLYYRDGSSVRRMDLATGELTRSSR